MKFRILALVATLAFATTAGAAEKGMVSIFDGKTLEGWEQLNGTATYKVVDGAIQGTTMKGSPNSFLCSKKLYGDFELQFEVKVDDGLNSGVQIRSNQKTKTKAEIAKDEAAKAKAKAAGKKAPKIAPEGRVNGPQVEIEMSPGQSGYVYGEACGGWMSKEPSSKDPKVKQHSLMKNGEWNKFRVVATGPRIQTWINGKQVTDLVDEDKFKTHPKGFIGLQVHGIGNKTETFQVAWKNISVKEIKGANAKKGRKGKGNKK